MNGKVTPIGGICPLVVPTTIDVEKVLVKLEPPCCWEINMVWKDKELSYTSKPLIHPTQNLTPYSFVINSSQSTRIRPMQIDHKVVDL